MLFFVWHQILWKIKRREGRMWWLRIKRSKKRNKNLRWELREKRNSSFFTLVISNNTHHLLKMCKTGWKMTRVWLHSSLSPPAPPPPAPFYPGKEEFLILTFMLSYVTLRETVKKMSGEGKEGEWFDMWFDATAAIYSFPWINSTRRSECHMERLLRVLQNLTGGDFVDSRSWNLRWEPFSFSPLFLFKTFSHLHFCTSQSKSHKLLSFMSNISTHFHFSPIFRLSSLFCCC